MSDPLLDLQNGTGNNLVRHRGFVAPSLRWRPRSSRGGQPLKHWKDERVGGRASARLASLAFIEARLDRYGGGEALSVCPLSLSLSVITNLMRLRNRRANSNMKLNTGAGCATHFQGIQIASSHTNINRQPTASLAPVTTRRPREDRHFGDDSRARSP